MQLSHEQHRVIEQALENHIRLAKDTSEMSLSADGVEFWKREEQTARSALTALRKDYLARIRREARAAVRHRAPL